ncbi:MAG: hypothetical protein WCX46_00335 [Candidatus Paceibacterota bacterium]
MEKGTVIFILVIAFLVYYFLGLKIFLYCIPLAIVIFLICFFYPIFRDEGWVGDYEKWFSKIWKRYLKWEVKFFKWIDEIF